jgi:hypothetical protein
VKIRLGTFWAQKNNYFADKLTNNITKMTGRQCILNKSKFLIQNQN